VWTPSEDLSSVGRIERSLCSYWLLCCVLSCAFPSKGVRKELSR
jgi:hypothetical protein